MNKILKFIKKYFRKDNLAFALKVLLSFVSTISSYLGIITFSLSKGINILFLCLVSLLGTIGIITFTALVYHKFEYYRALTKYLEESDEPLYRICSYLAKKKTRETENRCNDIRITELIITYDIDDIKNPFIVNNACNESIVDFTVTYDVKATNQLNQTSRIYHNTLSTNKNNIEAKYRFSDEDCNYQNMNIESSFINNKNIALWYADKAGHPIEPNQSFEYKIQIKYTRGFHLLERQHFIIDPMNYANQVDKFEVIIRCKSNKLKNIIETPELSQFYNGLHTDEKYATNKFEIKDKIDYETYYSIDRDNVNDYHYVIGVYPKNTLLIGQQNMLLQNSETDENEH